MTSKPQIAVVDYGMGNRRSVQKALEHVGAGATITRDPGRLQAADALVVPGVGAFPRAMHNLGSYGLIEIIRAHANQGRPLLGICLGMQLLFDSSEEHEPTPGLGLISGTVTRLDAGSKRLPHIGWNEVRFERGSRLTNELPATGCPFYHVHSFVARPANLETVTGTAEYGERFATLVESRNVYGAQFHPEKSSAHGLQMLRNFVRLSAGSEVSSARTRAAA
jgi:glutamine amidotransferase